MKSIFKGKIVKKNYYYELIHNESEGYIIPKLLKCNTTFKNKTFLEIDIEEPPLREGERFYNHDCDEIYYIEDAMRSSNNDIIYFTDKIIKITDNKKSLEEEETKINKEYNNYLAQKEEKNNKKWWKRLFNK